MSIIKSIKQVLGLGPAAENHFWDGSVANQLTLKRGTPDAPGTTVMQVVNGKVSFPQTVTSAVFIGANSSAGSITTGVPAKLSLPELAADTNGWWNAGNNRYIPQVAGYYRVTGKFTGISSTADLGVAEANIYKNGASVSAGSLIFGAGLANVSDARSEVNTIVAMNGSTDYIELWARVVGGGTLTVQNFEMTIDLVRAGL